MKDAITYQIIERKPAPSLSEDQILDLAERVQAGEAFCTGLASATRRDRINYFWAQNVPSFFSVMARAAGIVGFRDRHKPWLAETVYLLNRGDLWRLGNTMMVDLQPIDYSYVLEETFLMVNPAFVDADTDAYVVVGSTRSTRVEFRSPMMRIEDFTIFTSRSDAAAYRLSL